MEQIDEQGTAHSVYGASAMHRIMHCPGSVSLHLAELKKGNHGKSSAAALHGTAVHSLIERCLRDGLLPETFLNTVDKETGHTYTERDIECVYITQSRIDKYEDEFEGVGVEYEQKLTLPSVDEACFGTSDINIAKPFKRGVVLDFKNGRSKVYVKDNPQIIYYGIGMVDKYDLEGVYIGIIQPNATGEEEDVYMSDEELDVWREKFKLAVAESRMEKPRFDASDSKACFFCPAKQAGTCAKYKEKQTEAILKLAVIEDGDESTNLVSDTELENKMPEYQDMSTDKIAYALKNRAIIMEWFDGLYQHAQESFDEEPIPGYYMKQGKPGNRAWENEKVVEQAAKSQVDLWTELCYSKKLLSPTQMQKKVRKEVFEETFQPLIVRAEGKYTLEVDDRPSKGKITPVKNSL